ncbi:MAG: hypothetical protein JSU65_13815 [Candidatus Zixiibacteriota bacterium]|nr:MAG: hypothetical protein JSU65_13815 [candidate division Zixibacteria bacterium]
MPSKLRTILESTYAKIVFGGLVCFCGVVAGIYVTYGLIGPNTTPMPAVYFDDEERRQTMKEEGKYPLVERGDLFPLEDFQYADSTIGNFEDVLQGRLSVLLLVHFDCGGCVRMLADWKTTVEPHLRDDVQVIVVVGQVPFHLPDPLVELVDGYRLLFIDREYFRDVYHFRVWPTLVGVDEYGLITDIQLGYPGKFEKRLLGKIINPALVESNR